MEPTDEEVELGLKDDAAALALPTRTLPEQPWYWALWAVPLVGLVGSYSWQRRESYLQHNAVRLRSSRAHKEAQAALRQIERSDCLRRMRTAQSIKSCPTIYRPSSTSPSVA